MGRICGNPALDQLSFLLNGSSVSVHRFYYCPYLQMGARQLFLIRQRLFGDDHLIWRICRFIAVCQLLIPVRIHVELELMYRLVQKIALRRLDLLHAEMVEAHAAVLAHSANGNLAADRASVVIGDQYHRHVGVQIGKLKLRSCQTFLRLFCIGLHNLKLSHHQFIYQFNLLDFHRIYNGKRQLRRTYISKRRLLLHKIVGTGYRIFQLMRP